MADYELSGFANKHMESSDRFENETVAFKCTVKNNGDNEDFHLKTQGLDEEGFQVHCFYLTGKVPQGTTKTISTSQSISTKDFNKIKSWSIE